jgi:hypothetical protein
MDTARAAALGQQAASTHPGPSSHSSARSPRQASLLRRCDPQAALAWWSDAPSTQTAERPRHQRLLVAISGYKTAALGLGFGDRFGGFRGRSGSFKEMVLQAEKPGE